MASTHAYFGVLPKLSEGVYLAEGARVIGDVELGSEASVWFNAVVRGDVCPVRIGARTNVQDNATLHVTHDTGPLSIGSDVTIGHNAVLHACTVHDRALIGMGSILLDGCVVETDTYIAAGSLLLGGFRAPSGTLVAGSPAQVKRPLRADEVALIRQSADNYVRYADEHRRSTPQA